MDRLQSDEIGLFGLVPPTVASDSFLREDYGILLWIGQVNCRLREKYWRGVRVSRCDSMRVRGEHEQEILEANYWKVLEEYYSGSPGADQPTLRLRLEIDDRRDWQTQSREARQEMRAP